MLSSIRRDSVVPSTAHAAAKPMTSLAALCPANQVVVGFQGRSGAVNDALLFQCASLTVGPAPNYNLMFGATVTTGIIGGQTGGSPFAAVECPSGQVAVSQCLDAGDAIDVFGLACAAVTIVVK